MNERRRPSVLKDDTRGVAKEGNGYDESDVSVIVEGVRVIRVGDGGNTKSVCEGVETIDKGLGLVNFSPFCDVRRLPGGTSGLRVSTRERGGAGDVFTGTIGEEGTGGSMPMGGGRRRGLPFCSNREGMSKDDLTAVAGG